MSDPKKPFVLQSDRTQVTKEPELGGKWTPKFPDMLSLKNQGGGKVPADFTWRSNPKQTQEELTDRELRQRHDEQSDLPDSNLAHTRRK